jgi:hypothetical protein
MVTRCTCMACVIQSGLSQVRLCSDLDGNLSRERASTICCLEWSEIDLCLIKWTLAAARARLKTRVCRDGSYIERSPGGYASGQSNALAPELEVSSF